jgi:TM2 domain-containing membrane protein YozV
MNESYETQDSPTTLPAHTAHAPLASPQPAGTLERPSEAPLPAPAHPVAYPQNPHPQAAAPVINIVNQQGGGGFNPALIAMGASDKSPGTALLLGVLFTGLGQAYNGQFLKAFLFFAVSIPMWFILMGWIVHVAAFIEAYMTAKKKREQYHMMLAGMGGGTGQVARLG